jgi:uncharacterized SAM-binding protein YcdF (DUF218 family)
MAGSHTWRAKPVRLVGGGEGWQGRGVAHKGVSLSGSVLDLLLPPASLAVAALLLLLAPGRRGRLGAMLLLLLLVMLSMPWVGLSLLASLDLPAEAETGAAPEAIVILSGDVERVGGGERGDVEAGIGPLTLERERAGAALARRTGLPVLVTGGLVTASPPVAEMMAESLRADFGVTVRWVENRSGTTWENASFSVPMLRAGGVRRAYLVTHAWHMRRAALAFARAGLDVVPAPVRRDPGPRWVAEELVPRATAWLRSYYALHEWAGYLQYRLRS